MSDEDWDPDSAGRWRYTSTARHPRPDAAAVGLPTTRSSCASTPTTRPRIHLPPVEFGVAWQPVVDTAAGPGEIGEATAVKAGNPVRVQARAMVVLQAVG